MKGTCLRRKTIGWDVKEEGGGAQVGNEVRRVGVLRLSILANPRRVCVILASRAKGVGRQSCRRLALRNTLWACLLARTYL